MKPTRFECTVILLVTFIIGIAIWHDYTHQPVDPIQQYQEIQSFIKNHPHPWTHKEWTKFHQITDTK